MKLLRKGLTAFIALTSLNGCGSSNIITGATVANEATQVNQINKETTIASTSNLLAPSRTTAPSQSVTLPPLGVTQLKGEILLPSRVFTSTQISIANILAPSRLLAPSRILAPSRQHFSIQNHKEQIDSMKANINNQNFDVKFTILSENKEESVVAYEINNIPEGQNQVLSFSSSAMRTTLSTLFSHASGEKIQSQNVSLTTTANVIAAQEYAQQAGKTLEQLSKDEVNGLSLKAQEAEKKLNEALKRTAVPGEDLSQSILSSSTSAEVESASQFEFSYQDAMITGNPIIIDENTMLRWSNDSSQPLTIISKDFLFDNMTLQPGDSFSFHFKYDGKYSFKLRGASSHLLVVDVR